MMDFFAGLLWLYWSNVILFLKDSSWQKSDKRAARCTERSKEISFDRGTFRSNRDQCRVTSNNRHKYIDANAFISSIKVVVIYSWSETGPIRAELVNSVWCSHIEVTGGNIALLNIIGWELSVQCVHLTFAFSLFFDPAPEIFLHSNNNPWGRPQPIASPHMRGWRIASKSRLFCSTSRRRLKNKLYSITVKPGETENKPVISGPPDGFLSPDLDSGGEDRFRRWYNRLLCTPCQYLYLETDWRGLGLSADIMQTGGWHVQSPFKL